MAITRVKTSSVAQGPSTKKTLLGGNDVILGGSYDAIGVVDIGATSVSDVTFSSIPGTYKHLQVRIIAKDTTTGTGDLRYQFNGDSALNYSFHWLTGNGASASAGGYGGTGYGNINNWASGTGATNQFSAAIIDIFDYANTNKYKTGRSLAGRDNNGGGVADLSSMSWRNTNAITSIKFFLTTGNIPQYSSFALYGIK
jgi:hypothetical protein